MGRLRLHFGKSLNLIDESKHNLLWIVDFPMFEWSDEENRFMAMHHPFTSPCIGDLDPAIWVTLNQLLTILFITEQNSAAAVSEFTHQKFNLLYLKLSA